MTLVKNIKMEDRFTVVTDNIENQLKYLARSQHPGPDFIYTVKTSPSKP